MPRRKDVTYYVGRVTWGMILFFTQKVKEKTSSHVKCFHICTKKGIF